MNTKCMRSQLFLRLLAMVLVAGVVRNARAVTEEKVGIPWTLGSATVHVGNNATLAVPEGYRFTDSTGARKFMELTHNLYTDQLGILLPNTKPDWFVIFEFSEIGYVKDDETLDSATIDRILDNIKSSNEKGNAELRAKGWDTLDVEGWNQRPFYDPVTHSLTWAITASSKEGKIVNYDSRVLGRRGVMRVKMVLAPEMVQEIVPQFQKVVTSVAFVGGESYAEFRSGDRMAEYGLVGLMTGGAAVVAVKFWKPLIAFGATIVVAIGSALKKIKNFFTGKRP